MSNYEHKTYGVAYLNFSLFGTHWRAMRKDGAITLWTKGPISAAQYEQAYAKAERVFKEWDEAIKQRKEAVDALQAHQTEYRS